MKSPRSHSPATGASGHGVLAALLVLACCLAGQAACAQERYLFQGIVDAELYHTDTGSPLLTRNGGDVAALARLQLWAAFQLSSSLQVYAQGEVETDNFEGYRESDSDLDQVAVRYMHPSAPWLLLEAGKILSPLATYSERRLSTRNPLIGRPYLYTQAYPRGAKLMGSAGPVDYQLAWVEPDGGDEDYRTMEPDATYRPALSVGVTPFTGLRLGLAWTRGPYLSRGTDGYLPGDSRWRDYNQSVVGVDFQFSRGYLEFSGQALRTRSRVPYRESAPEDSAWFLELKYTWTPRLYGALRYQDVENSSVSYLGPYYWHVESSRFKVLEAGLGYRFSPDLLLKLAYQTDHWDDSGYGYPRRAKGHALGLQLSWGFDLVSLLSEKP